MEGILHHNTSMREYYPDKAEELLNSSVGSKIRREVQLMITSPPFPLSNKKSYGNLQGEEYKQSSLRTQ